MLNILAKGIIYKKIRNNREKWVFKGFVSKYRFLSQFRNFGLSKDYYIELLKQILIQYNLLNLFKNDLNKYDIVYNAEHKKYFVLDKRLGISKEKLLKIMTVLGKNYNYDVKYFDIAKDLIKIFRNK